MNNNYDKLYKIYKKYENIDNWYVAIGLQKVDNLQPSIFLINLINNYIEGNICYDELDKKLFEYYELQRIINKDLIRTKECDIVSSRIVNLISNNNFEFSIDYLKRIHEFLFKNIYVFAGKFRKNNLTKNEKILNGCSVNYTDYHNIESFLNYDFENQKNKTINVENISSFTSNIWQIHPFNEGNTRTVLVFIIKYLKNRGYKINIEIFKNNSLEFRNALVLSNYQNLKEKIYPDISYLNNFFKEILIDEIKVKKKILK